MSGREVGSPVAQDLVGRGVRAERPAHHDDRMLHCSHPMRFFLLKKGTIKVLDKD